MMQRAVILFAFVIVLTKHEVLSLDCSMFRDNNQIFNKINRLYPVDPFERSFFRSSSIQQLSDGSLSIRIYGSESIPSYIFCLTNVIKFEVRSSSFEKPNDFMSNLLHYASTLSTLFIEDTKIGQLNEDFGQMIHLKLLHLVNVGLRSLPSSIRKLDVLERMDLSKNDLTRLPGDWNSMSALKYLILSENPRLKYLHSINGHPGLIEIRADSCWIRRLPQNLPNVSRLYLSDNQIKNLDGIETIGWNTSSPKEFYFRKNRIHRIPTNIVLVVNLSRLVLDGNQLRNIPEPLVNVKSLKCISFNSNPIDDREWKETIRRFCEKFGPEIICGPVSPC